MGNRDKGMPSGSTALESQTAPEEGSYLAVSLMAADCILEELHGASVLLVLRLQRFPFFESAVEALM